jgi:hypothetical protein
MRVGAAIRAAPEVHHVKGAEGFVDGVHATAVKVVELVVGTCRFPEEVAVDVADDHGALVFGHLIQVLADLVSQNFGERVCLQVGVEVLFGPTREVARMPI